ncbi:hypothetical protein D3C84_878500 [compost metagenome]
MRVEAGHTAGRIEARHPCHAGINHYPYTINGQARLCDIGGQYHLTLADRRWLDSGSLGSKIQLTMKRTKQDLTVPIKVLKKFCVNATDFSLTW